MYLSLMQIFSVIAMVVVTFVLIFAYRAYLAANSERRMLSMIESIGLDPAIASRSDLEEIMSEVRQRCRSCTSEDVCERWLTCNENDDNDFCPNAKTFEALK
jgi:Family of unknown function (DUF6455)